MTWLAAALLALGAVTLVIAAAGLFVFRDALARQHAATKAGSLGIALLAAGTAVAGGDAAWAWRALALVAITWVTMPVASHALARAALRARKT